LPLSLVAPAHPWGQSGDSECRDRSESAGRERRQKLQVSQFSQVKRRP
jgi:hypothetical protein